MKLLTFFVIIISFCLLFETSGLMLKRITDTKTKNSKNEKLKYKFNIVPNSNFK